MTEARREANMEHEGTLNRKTWRQKQRRRPWGHCVSVGIATICQKGGVGRIVGCMDKKATVQPGTASSESTFKLVSLSADLKAIFAGTIPSARELIQMYRDHFNARPFDRSNILEQLRIPPVLL